MATKGRMEARERRRTAIRKRVHGTTERPRLAVFRSLRHMYAQVIDDQTSQTLVSASTLSVEIRTDADKAKKVDAAKLVGKLVAKKCLEKGIDKVVFDRGGFHYHGRITALADAARESGLKF